MSLRVVNRYGSRCNQEVTIQVASTVNKIKISCRTFHIFVFFLSLLRCRSDTCDRNSLTSPFENVAPPTPVQVFSRPAVRNIEIRRVYREGEVAGKEI